MKLNFPLTLLAIFVLVTTFSKAQIGIGTTSPHPSAILDVTSTNKGFLLPRLEFSQINEITNPAEGLLVYCTNCCQSGSPVLYTTKWTAITSDCETLIQPIIPKANNDFDGDGINNDVDIDDDNDGIKDVDELCESTTNHFGQKVITDTDNHTFEYDVENSGQLIIDILEIDNSFELYINDQNIFNGTEVTVSGNTAQQISMDIAGQDGTKQAFKVDMEFEDPNDSRYQSTNGIEAPWTPRPDGLPRVRIEINRFGIVNAYATATPTDNNSKYNDGLRPIVLKGYTETTNERASVVPFNTINLNNGINHVKIVSTNEDGDESFIGTFTSKIMCNDTDFDGLTNDFDLDSDGDGCSDAFESGATTDQQELFKFPTNNVGLNGLDNSLETTADNGIINYSIINNYEYTTNSSINLCNNNPSITFTGSPVYNGPSPINNKGIGFYNEAIPTSSTIQITFNSTQVTPYSFIASDAISGLTYSASGTANIGSNSINLTPNAPIILKPGTINMTLIGASNTLIISPRIDIKSLPVSQTVINEISIDIDNADGDNNHNTGGDQIWMDRNLGAHQKATSRNDGLSYGGMYQWGRPEDGHEIIVTNGDDFSESTGLNGTTPLQANSDTPANHLFITTVFTNWQTLSATNDNLWQGASGINNPCPNGFRLPTESELTNAISTLNISNNSTAASSILGLPASGHRNIFNGSVDIEGVNGSYWTSSIESTNAVLRNIENTSTASQSFARSLGNNIRCIKN